MFRILYLLGLAALAEACRPGKYLDPCGAWTEWTGLCNNDQCGHCSVQTRSREPTNATMCTKPLNDTRQCYNLACVQHVPLTELCTPGCMPGCAIEGLSNGQARCKVNGTTIDPSKDLFNRTDSIQLPGKTCHPEMIACGEWSEWSGDCENDLCGQCNVQTRKRTNVNKCTLPLNDKRQCFNLACHQNVPLTEMCTPGCMNICDIEGLPNGQARCKLKGSTIDPAKDLFNKTDSIQLPGKTCHPQMVACGDWSEWSGDCETQHCGHCNVQTRARTNVKQCTRPLTQTRQCLNLACRETTQPDCFNNGGCLPSCEWEQLNETYHNGQYTSQARCKLPGTTINIEVDDYQIWNNTLDTVNMTTCHPNMTKDCGPWSEWSGLCREDLCGHCFAQTRSRLGLTANCRGLTDTRQCFNLACNTKVPELANCTNGCLPECQIEGLPNGQARCKLSGTVIDSTKDDYQNFLNKSESVQNTGKRCHPRMTPCSEWSEWSGDCDTKHCGQCNKQTRSRKNQWDCKLPLSETRQCLNLACREITQPTCFDGSGCLPTCEWEQLTSTYQNGQFTGQARCKIPGTTIRVGIDDYQVWNNTLDTVHMTTCHPSLPILCGNWTEWTGNCETNFCGQCNVQTRSRININQCKQLTQTRQCYNLACRETTQKDCFNGGCLPSCEWEQLNETYYNGQFNGQARCKIIGSTIDISKDDYMIFNNKIESIQDPGKTCHPKMKPCGPWTEWTGNCETNFCGQCNVQTRTRENQNKCTEPLTDSRQCYNLACVARLPALKNCIDGCMSGCKREYLPNNQARCKKSGTTINPAKDDYMIFLNKPESIQDPGKTCHPRMIVSG